MLENEKQFSIPISIPIIGYHYSPLSQKFGIPRQPNLVSIKSYIDMVEPYNTLEAFEGITQFSHLWITWQAHHNHNSHQRNYPDNKQSNQTNSQTNSQLSFEQSDQLRSGHQSKTHIHPFKAKVRPPRLGGNTKLGVFATRSTYRPSQLGLSVVRLLKLDIQEGRVRLYIEGADMVDATPILDIKPYIAYSDSIDDAVSGFAPDKPRVKAVEISELAQSQICALLSDNHLDRISSEISHVKPVDSNQPKSERQLLQEDIDIICQLISQDPRPAYRQHDSHRIYYMRYKQYDVGFKMLEACDEAKQATEPENVLQIVSIQLV